MNGQVSDHLSTLLHLALPNSDPPQSDFPEVGRQTHDDEMVIEGQNDD